jgi:hypothetical protein
MDLQARKVTRVIQPEATSDGAAVKLKRSIATLQREPAAGMAHSEETNLLRNATQAELLKS